MMQQPRAAAFLEKRARSGFVLRPTTHQGDVLARNEVYSSFELTCCHIGKTRIGPANPAPEDTPKDWFVISDLCFSSVERRKHQR